MAYAAYANIDPRLLAEDRGNNAEAISAIGKGIKDTINNIDKEKEKERKLAKEKKDQAWIDYERRTIVQNNFDKNKRLMNLHARIEKETGIKTDGPAQMIIPPGFSEKDGQILVNEEVTNAVNALKKLTPSQILRRQKRNKKRAGRGADPLSYKEGDLDVQGNDGNLVVDYEENDEVIVEKPEVVEEAQEGPQSTILKGINEQDPNGQYGLKDFTNATEEEIITYLDSVKKVNGDLTLLKQGTDQITTGEKYDAKVNGKISSLQTALDNNAVHVVYRGADNKQQYTWYDENTKKWRFANHDGLFKADGTINLNILNDGKDVINTVDILDVTAFLNADDVVKPLLKDLRDEKYVSPGEKQQIEDVLIRQFTGDKDFLESFVRNNSGFVDPTPKDGVVTPQDAAAWYMGYMSESEVWKKGWDKQPEVSDSSQRMQDFYSRFQDPNLWVGVKINGDEVVSQNVDKNNVLTLYTGNKNVTINADNQETYPGSKIGEVVTTETKPIKFNLNDRDDVTSLGTASGLGPDEIYKIQSLITYPEKKTPKGGYESYDKTLWNTTSVDFNSGDYQIYTTDKGTNPGIQQGHQVQMIRLFREVANNGKFNPLLTQKLKSSPDLAPAFEYWKKHKETDVIPPELLTGSLEQRQSALNALNNPDSVESSDSIINKYLKKK